MPKILALGYPACVLACLAVPVGAAEWTTNASVTPGVTYTDNVCLTKGNEQQEWIGLVTPAGSITADGNRANLRFDGLIEINSLTDSRLEDLGCNPAGFGNRKQFAPQIDAAGDAVLVEDWLYLDASGYVDQNEVTPFASGGGDSLDRRGNTNTTYSYRISPYVSRRFKDLAQLNLRVTWDEQNNTADVVRDSTEESAKVLVENLPGISKVLWGLQGDYSKVSYSDTPNQLSNQDSELQSAQINLGYQLNRVWQVNGFYGQEWNDFVSSQDDIDGTYWDAGLRWAPNLRTTVEAGTGDRFFGSTPRFSITRRHKRSSFNASYAKTLTYNRDIRTLQDSASLDPGLRPPPGVNPGQTTLGGTPILDERFTLGYSYGGRRTGFGVSAFQSDQTQQGSGFELSFTESTFRGVSVSADRRLFGQTSVNVGLNWNEQEPKKVVNGGLAAKSEMWTGILGAERQISQNMNVALSYRYTDRQSENVFNEYTENRFTLDLRFDL